MLRIRSFIAMAASILMLSSCGHVSVLDKETCVDEGSLGAHCADYLTPDTRDIPQPAWDNLRFGWFCQDASDYAEGKNEEEELCSIKGVTCDYEAKRAIKGFFATAHSRAQELRDHAESARALLQ